MWSGLFYSQSFICFRFIHIKALFIKVRPIWGHSAHTVSPIHHHKMLFFISDTYFITKIYISVPSLCCSFPPLLLVFSRFCLVLCLGESFLQCKLASDVRSSQGCPSVSVSQVLGSQPLYFQLCL